VRRCCRRGEDGGEVDSDAGRAEDRKVAQRVFESERSGIHSKPVELYKSDQI